MAMVHPTLDSRGYLTDPKQVSDAILGYFLNTKGSQSNFFIGRLKPLATLIAENPGNIVSLAEACQTALATSYDAYFDSVSIVVGYNTNANAFSGSEAVYNLNISGQVTYGGVVLQLDRMLGQFNKNFTSVLPLSAT